MATFKTLASVEMRLHDMLYVSYLVPVGRLRGLIPAALQPAEVVPGKVFFTVVIFRGRTSGAATIPTPRIPFDQVNIRTYVTDPMTGRPAVYFVHCGISGGLITFLYRILSGMPVEHTPFAISAERSRTGDYEKYSVSGEWHGRFSIEAKEVAPSVDSLEPFVSRKEAMDYLIDPLVGFYEAGSSLRRLEVFHEPLQPRRCDASEVAFPYLLTLGLVTGDEIRKPHNLLLVPYTPFLIYLPARKTP